MALLKQRILTESNLGIPHLNTGCAVSTLFLNDFRHSRGVMSGAMTAHYSNCAIRVLNRSRVTCDSSKKVQTENHFSRDATALISSFSEMRQPLSWVAKASGVL